MIRGGAPEEAGFKARAANAGGQAPRTLAECYWNANQLFWLARLPSGIFFWGKAAGCSVYSMPMACYVIYLFASLRSTQVDLLPRGDRSTTSPAAYAHSASGVLAHAFHHGTFSQAIIWSICRQRSYWQRQQIFHDHHYQQR